MRNAVYGFMLTNRDEHNQLQTKWALICFDAVNGVDFIDDFVTLPQSLPSATKSRYKALSH
jgi:hypothetical protein